MSTQMMKSETLSYIANFIVVQIFYGFNYTGFTVDGLEKAFEGHITTESETAKEIYTILYGLNVKAVYARYKDKTMEIYSIDELFLPDFPNKTIHKRKKQEDYHAMIEKWHYQMLKSIECYLYWCSEAEEIITDPVFKALENLKNALMSYIIHNMKEYELTVWG